MGHLKSYFCCKKQMLHRKKKICIGLCCMRCTDSYEHISLRLCFPHGGEETLFLDSIISVSDLVCKLSQEWFDRFCSDFQWCLLGRVSWQDLILVTLIFVQGHTIFPSHAYKMVRLVCNIFQDWLDGICPNFQGCSVVKISRREQILMTLITRPQVTM